MNRAQALKELKKTFAILDGDVKAIKSLHEDKMNAFQVRTTIRAYSALIEGLLYQMRQVALQSENTKYTVFSLEERMVLCEKTFILNDKGEIKEKEKFEPALPMLLFTLKQFVKIHGAEFSPDTGDHGWECMKKFITIRNRVVHPKSKSDLEISECEWHSVKLGLDWFYLNIKALFAEVDKADAKYKSMRV